MCGTNNKTGTALFAVTLVAVVWLLPARGAYATGVPLHDGLLSYWPLSEGSGAVAHDTAYLLASSGVISDNGQLRNSPTWLGDAGVFGGGVKFNGVNQDVLLPSSADMNIGASAVTLSAWVKIDLLPANQSGSFAGIFDSAIDSYVLYLDKSANELRFKVTTAGGAERPGVPASMLDTTSWHHVMGTYDGAGKARIFFDGDLVDTHVAGVLTGPVLSGQIGGVGSQPAASGANSPSNLFKGGIGDVALWNRALGAAEAQYLYNDGIGHAVGAANPSIEPLIPTPPSNRPIVVAAHRGNSAYAPENTLSAFAAAKGFAERVEFDVQVSKDGKLVVMHDSTVNRTTNGSGSVASLNYAGYIDGLDAGSWFSPTFAGEPVPTMQQSVQGIMVDGMVPLIERKSGSAAAYVNELTQMGVLDDVVIIAFDWNFLADVRALAPNVQLGALGSGTLNASVISSIAATGADFVNWGDGTAVTEANINLARSAGLDFHVWTVNSDARMQQLIDLGVDGITTDAPETLRELTPWPTPGDFNRDGFVDVGDYELWREQYGLAGLREADGNGDGVVDAADYTVWRDAEASATESAAVVPEPLAAVLLCFAAAPILARHRRQSTPPVHVVIRQLN